MKNFTYLTLCLLAIPWSSDLFAQEKLFTKILKNNKEIVVVKLALEDEELLIQAKEVYKKTFFEVYKDYTAEQMCLENKPDFLKIRIKGAFEQEEKDFYAHKSNSVFLVGIDVVSNKIIAFASFDVNEALNGSKIYIRQLVIDSSYGRCGLGTALIFDTIKMIAQNYPVEITVCTRSINQPAIDFYHSLNFKDAPIKDVHSEFPEYIFCGFNLTLNKEKMNNDNELIDVQFIIPSIIIDVN